MVDIPIYYLNFNCIANMIEQKNNPLHAKTLEYILRQLLEHYEWSDLAEKINLKCFQSNPSIKSCLKFLRRTPWARAKVEELYLSTAKYMD